MIALAGMSAAGPSSALRPVLGGRGAQVSVAVFDDTSDRNATVTLRYDST